MVQTTEGSPGLPKGFLWPGQPLTSLLVFANWHHAAPANVVPADLDIQ